MFSTYDSNLDFTKIILIDPSCYTPTLNEKEKLSDFLNFLITSSQLKFGDKCILSFSKIRTANDMRALIFLMHALQERISGLELYWDPILLHDIWQGEIGNEVDEKLNYFYQFHTATNFEEDDIVLSIYLHLHRHINVGFYSASAKLYVFLGESEVVEEVFDIFNSQPLIPMKVSLSLIPFNQTSMQELSKSNPIDMDYITSLYHLKFSRDEATFNREAVDWIEFNEGLQSDRSTKPSVVYYSPQEIAKKLDRMASDIINNLSFQLGLNNGLTPTIRNFITQVKNPSTERVPQKSGNNKEDGRKDWYDFLAKYKAQIEEDKEDFLRAKKLGL